jgi:hypothetical protein
MLRSEEIKNLILNKHKILIKPLRFIILKYLQDCTFNTLIATTFKIPPFHETTIFYVLLRKNDISCHVKVQRGNNLDSYNFWKLQSKSTKNMIYKIKLLSQPHYGCHLTGYFSYDHVQFIGHFCCGQIYSCEFEIIKK